MNFNTTSSNKIKTIEINNVMKTMLQHAILYYTVLVKIIDTIGYDLIVTISYFYEQFSSLISKINNFQSTYN